VNPLDVFIKRVIANVEWSLTDPPGLGPQGPVPPCPTLAAPLVSHGTVMGLRPSRPAACDLLGSRSARARPVGPAGPTLGRDAAGP
jgi:hypothetical protein